MTVSYSGKIHTVRKLDIFYKIMTIWKGSVLQLIWRKLFLYLIAYSVISVLYRYVLVSYPESKLSFEKLCLTCTRNRHSIPVMFLLGFYVSQVVSRWINQFQCISWPDKFSMRLSVHISDNSNQFVRHTKRTIIRLILLAFVLTLKNVSSRVNKRFPTLEHLVNAKLMTLAEKDKMAQILNSTEHPCYWVPMIWAMNSLKKLEGLFPHYLAYRDCLEDLSQINMNNGLLVCYGWINFPLVYTQVVMLSVHFYFLTTLFSSQFLHPDTQHYEELGYTNAYDYYVPVFTILEYINFMGWLNVAMVLLNPFGEDEDDYETNYLIDRNLQIALMIVDDTDFELPSQKCPYLLAGEVVPQNLPHTDISTSLPDNPPVFEDCSEFSMASIWSKSARRFTLNSIGSNFPEATHKIGRRASRALSVCSGVLQKPSRKRMRLASLDESSYFEASIINILENSEPKENDKEGNGDLSVIHEASVA